MKEPLSTNDPVFHQIWSRKPVPLDKLIAYLKCGKKQVIGLEFMVYVEKARWEIQHENRKRRRATAKKLQGGKV